MRDSQRTPGPFPALDSPDARGRGRPGRRGWLREHDALATVGARAGYSRSLATARFGSKDKLLEALVDRIVTRWNISTVLPLAEQGSTRR